MNRFIEYNNILRYDFSRQLFDDNEYHRLLGDMKEKVIPKMKRMRKDKKINFTENRSVGHFVLRANDEDDYYKKEVMDVLLDIDGFVEAVHNGNWLSATGKKFKNVVSIGIGGSYLGIEFFYKAIPNSKRMDLRLLANIDPWNIKTSLEGLDLEETLVIVISKTFTTQETMLNAECIKAWLLNGLSGFDCNKEESCHTSHVLK